MAQAAGQPVPATPAAAPSEAEVLRQQLAAQMAINEQLRRRLNALEEERAARNPNAPAQAALDVTAPRPPADLDDPNVASAIEQALGAKGLVLLPPGRLRATPSFSWSTAENGEAFALGMSLDVGLPAGMMLSARIPYVHRDTNAGSNTGVGDMGIALSKKLMNETASAPALVARLGYVHNNGKAPFSPVPIGSGFRAVDVSLSAYKRFDPLVLYGNVSYAHAFDRPVVVPAAGGGTAFTGAIAPGNTRGIGMGVSLAATPEISLDAGASMAYSAGTRISPASGVSFVTPSTKVGFLTFGTSILLKRNLLLSLSVGSGLTRQSADSVFSVALPYTF
jgi:hypothetical protein